MRITRPAPGARVPLDEINLADTDLYTKADAHLVWQTLRSERPAGKSNASVDSASSTR